MEELARLEELATSDERTVQYVQSNALYQLLEYAISNSDYYSQTIPDSVVADDSQRVRPGDLSSVPQLRKDVIRSDLEDIVCRDTDSDTYRNRSGGSTGQPLEFIQDTKYRDSARAVSMLFDRWSGYQIGEPKVRLWGSERDIFDQRESISGRLRRLVKNEIWLNSFRMAPEDMDEYVERINSFKPKQILGYAESTYALARHIEANDHTVHSPTSVMTSAGKLYPNMRRKIEDVFGAPVFDRYGSREVGGIACECPSQEGLHISSPTHVVEVVDEDGNHVDEGELGHVLVTSLRNHAMPFIRYRIGDMAVWGGDGCSCEIPFPVLEEVSGRETSMFYDADGTLISPEYFIHLLGVVLDPDWLEKFQVVQKDTDHVRVQVISSLPQEQVELDHDNNLEEITEKIQLVMGEDCTVEISFVSEIPPSDSGKYLYAISELDRPNP